MSENASEKYYQLSEEQVRALHQRPNLIEKREPYNFQSQEFLSGRAAREISGSTYLNVSNLIEFTTNAEQVSDYCLSPYYKKEKTDSGENSTPTKVITGPLSMYGFSDVFYISAEALRLPETAVHRIVMPYGHQAICLDVDKNTKHVDVIVLDASVKAVGENQDGLNLLNMMAEALQQCSYSSIATHINQSPICPSGSESVCVNEMCRQLLAAENPSLLPDRGDLFLKPDKVKALHLKNCRDYQRSQGVGYYNLDASSVSTLNDPVNLTSVNPQLIGYNHQSGEFLSARQAEKIPNTSFLSMVNLLMHARSKSDVDTICQSAFKTENLITGTTWIDGKNNFGMDELINVAVTEMLNPKSPAKRLVVPLSIISPDKEAHGVAFCLVANKTTKHLDMIVLEQHAQRDGGHLDFSKEINAFLKKWQESLAQRGISIATHTNEAPICRRQRVCGIVSQEMCRRLLIADDPVRLTRDKIPILTNTDVDELHRQNWSTYEKMRLKEVMKRIKKYKKLKVYQKKNGIVSARRFNNGGTR